MAILNYTTRVSVDKTVNQIQGILASHRAKAVAINYGKERIPEALSFIVETQHGDLGFRLPANMSAVAKVMARDRVQGWSKEGQPQRVAWRILKDWVEAQMAIVEVEMVTLEEVFLPYLLLPGSNHTLYERMIDKGFYLTEGKDSA